MTTRPQFVSRSPACPTALAVGSEANAQPLRVGESDPLAMSLGYKHDATKVGTKKHATYQARRVCAVRGDGIQRGTAGCGRCVRRPVPELVDASGWCFAWGKQA